MKLKGCFYTDDDFLMTPERVEHELKKLFSELKKNKCPTHPIYDYHCHHCLLANVSNIQKELELVKDLLFNGVV